MSRTAPALAMLVALVGGAPPAAAAPASAVTKTSAEPSTNGAEVSASATASSTPEPSGAARFQRSRYAWSRCTPNPDERACIRPRPARVLLLSIGAAAGGIAAGVLFALGDRLAPGDPATVLVGTGGLAGAGALLGMALGRLGGDDPARADRIRPALADLSYGLGPAAQLDERTSHAMAFRFAPTWSFRDNAGRVRLVGHVGGLLAATKNVDPRPQLAAPSEMLEGTAPVTLRERATSIGVGLDWAVRLPYPLLAPRRSAFLGPSEVRWKPDVQIRREVVDAGRDTERIVSRTMLLPLTVGMRWHVSPRQRFTMYLGPRLDFLALSAPGSKDLARGRAQLGPLYAEAWYDLDVPLTARARRDGRVRRTESNGQLTLGYTHARFDGRGFNVGPVVGFLGPLHVQWHTRVRPAGSPVAVQATAAAAIGNGVTLTAAIGVVAPDVSDLVRRGSRNGRAGGAR